MELRTRFGNVVFETYQCQFITIIISETFNLKCIHTTSQLRPRLKILAYVCEMQETLKKKHDFFR